MSYTNTTTHYQWPLPEETDLFNGLDDNQMKEDLDEKVYNLEQRSTGDHEAVTQLNERVTEVEQTVGGYDEQIEALEGTVGEHAERLVNLTNRQTELSRRLNGKAGESTIAAEYNEEESYLVGDFVYYANILYKCKNASSDPAGEFDSNDWDIVILTDELGGSTPEPEPVAAVDVSFNDAVAHLNARNVQTAIVALKALVDEIGGKIMPLLNFANPLFTFASGSLTFTASKECYIYGSIGMGNAILSINSTPVIHYIRGGSTAGNSLVVPPTKIKSGDVVTLSSFPNDTALSIFDTIN